MANYKIVDGKIYKEIGTNDLEQVRLKVEQVVNVITPLKAEITAYEAEKTRIDKEIAIREKNIDEYRQKLIADVELVKTAFPEQSQKLGF